MSEHDSPERRGGSGDWTSGRSAGGAMGGELLGGGQAERAAAIRQETGGVGVTEETGGPGPAPEQPTGVSARAEDGAPPPAGIGRVGASAGTQWSLGGGPQGDERHRTDASGGAARELAGDDRDPGPGTDGEER